LIVDQAETINKGDFAPQIHPKGDFAPQIHPKGDFAPQIHPKITNNQ
jgi:hypothetical protein